MQEAPNRWVGINYLNRDNKMAIPPAFWLQRLFDFDSDLVVFPSIQVPFAYVLARRARRTGGFNLHDPAFEKSPPDTQFCVARHLLPVCLIYRSGASWSIDNIIADLKTRDTWAAGGAEKFVDNIEEAEQKRDDSRRAALRDDMFHRSGDAWQSYLARTGQRTKIRYGHQSAKRASAPQIAPL